MSIRPPVTDKELASGTTMLLLRSLAKIFEGVPKGGDHEYRVLNNLFRCMYTVMDRKIDWNDEYFKNFSDALGKRRARLFIGDISKCLSSYSRAIKSETLPNTFFPDHKTRERTLASVRELPKMAEERRYHLPYMGMNYPRVNTHRCTGR